MARRTGGALETDSQSDQDQGREHDGDGASQSASSDRGQTWPEKRSRAALSEQGDHHEGSYHWQSWVLRGVLAAILALQLVRGNMGGAIVAAEGLVASFVPLAISRFSGKHVPWLMEITYLIAIVLQFGSESLKLFELFTYWDKIVHPLEIFLASGIATYLLLGYRHYHQLKIPDGLAAAGAMMFGMSLGAFWELVEFAMDWFGNAYLQKSNADTMTDILLNDAGAVFGTLLAFWLYRHWATDHEKQEFGEIAEWSTNWLANLLDRHGKAVGIAFGLVVAGIVFAGWFIDRYPLPPPPPTGHPVGWSESTPRQWDFTASDPGAPAAVLFGDWTTDQRGICRENPDHPHPGSETPGLVALDPGISYGGDQPFVATTHFTTERPPFLSGSAMDAALAFGVRGSDDYYVLRASVLHDAVSLDRFIHGRKRNLREEHYLMRGNEWHELQAQVSGDQVAALVDGRELFATGGLSNLDGGLGLWARVTTAGCFSDASVEPLASRQESVDSRRPSPSATRVTLAERERGLCSLLPTAYCLLPTCIWRRSPRSSGSPSPRPGPRSRTGQPARSSAG